MNFEVIVKHVYQDANNPSIQRILVDADYSMRYALFNSLLESKLDFEIKPLKEE